MKSAEGEAARKNPKQARSPNDENGRRRNNGASACIGGIANGGGLLVELASLADLRAVIRKPSDMGRFEPKQSAAWEEGVERFGKLRVCGAE